MRDSFPVRRLILMPIFSILIAIFVGFAFSTYWLENIIIDNLLNHEINHIFNELYKSMEEQSQFLKSEMVILSRYSSLRDYFISGNREALLQESKPIMESFGENYITHFYFHNANRVNFLRVHNPDTYGDLVNRPILLKSEQSGTFVSGLEVGMSGGLTLRTVLPWWNGKQLIGYLELGKEMEHFVEEVQQILGTRLYTFLHKEYFDKSAYKNPSRTFNTMVDWDSFHRMIFIGNKNTQYPDSLRQYLADNKFLADDAMSSISRTANSTALFSIPIHDTGHRIICRIIGIYDFSKYEELVLANNYILLGVSLGLILFLGLLFYRQIKLVEGRLRNAVVSKNKLVEEVCEREKIEQILRQERDFSQIILSSTGEGIYGMDNANLCTFVNRAGLEILGYDNDNIFIGEKIHSIIHHTRADGSPFPDTDCPIHAAQKKGYGIWMENEVFWRRDGSSFPVEYSCFPININNETIGSVVVFHDITQRKRAQEKEMYLAFQSGVAEMSATLLHNIGNAVMSISHRSELLENRSHYLVETGEILTKIGALTHKQMQRGQTEKQVLAALIAAMEDTGHEFLKIAKEDLLENANKIKKGVEHIASIVKIHNDSARPVIERKEFNLSQMVEDSIMIQEELLKKYAIKIDIQIPSSLGFVFLPRTQILQIMINLIKNARESIMENKNLDGLITITAERIDLDGVKITIVDNGYGIKEENIKNIFNYGMTTKVGGTGFGLHSAAIFIKLLCGDIEAHSAGLGKGAMFVIKIPTAFKRGL
ncbi:hypothetical protein CCP3SC5AM1_60044 [Gammaproteobacteria bacterium]